MGGLLGSSSQQYACAGPYPQGYPGMPGQNQVGYMDPEAKRKTTNAYFASLLSRGRYVQGVRELGMVQSQSFENGIYKTEEHLEVQPEMLTPPGSETEQEAISMKDAWEGGVQCLAQNFYEGTGLRDILKLSVGLNRSPTKNRRTKKAYY